MVKTQFKIVENSRYFEHKLSSSALVEHNLNYSRTTIHSPTPFPICANGVLDGAGIEPYHRAWKSCFVSERDLLFSPLFGVYAKPEKLPNQTPSHSPNQGVWA